MLKIISKISLLFSIAIFSLSACTTEKTPNNQISPDKIKAVATIFPIYDILRQVGGAKIEPILMLSPGKSPHTFEPTPAQIKQMQGAQIFFAIGANLDEWAKNIANSVDQSEVLELAEYIELKPFGEEENHEDDDEHGHEGLDPHYWLDPNNAIIIAKTISQKLSKIDPENKNYYEMNSGKFIKNIQDKAVEWKNKLKNLSQRELVLFHDAWGYFADYFNLKIIAAFEPIPGKTPSPKSLINFQEKIKKNNIQAIFIEPQLSKETIETMAKDLNISIHILDPLGGTLNRETYIELMDYNVGSIYNALNKK